MRPLSFLFFPALCIFALGCSGSADVDPAFVGDSATSDSITPGGETGNSDSASDAASTDASSTDDASTSDDSGSTSNDSGTGDAAAITRLPCMDTNALSNDLPFDKSGALEADVVAVGCPGDSDHLHVQVAIGSKRYDVALVVNDSTDPGNPPVGIYTADLPAGSAPYGWSSAGFSYTQNLAVHSNQFTMLAKAAMLARLKSELANAGRVSIHGKSYTDGTGVHDVHWYNSTEDGVILIRGAGAGGTDHAIAMRYSSMTF